MDKSEFDRLGIEVPFVLTERERDHTDRGGEVTYHGPGQLVGYPIIDLRRWGGGALKYVRALEQVIAETLAEFGISEIRSFTTGDSEGRPTGVWVRGS